MVPIGGDDVVFPATSAQFSVFCNLFPDVTLNSITFDGGKYSFTGHAKTLGITVDAGHQDLGSGLWIVNGRLFAAAESQITGIIFGRESTFTLDGAGTANVTIQGSFGGSITKDGSGSASITLASPGISGLVVNAGHLDLHGSSSNFGNVTINGGVVQNSTRVSATTLEVTGPASEYRGGGLFAGASAGTMEISRGAMLDAVSCHAFFQADTAPILTGSVLAPLSSCVGPPSAYLLDNRSSEPVIGTFTNYPEGSTFIVQGRLFRITYQGGDGNDVQVLAVPAVPFDLTGDRATDIAVYRPSEGVWYIRNVEGFAAVQWGLAEDKIVPGDYDGDGTVDEAVYRPSEGLWYVDQSSGIGRVTIPFGLDTDIPAPADYDADAKMDLAIFRPSTGEWWIGKSTSSQGVVENVPFGSDGDLPVAGDYDGDGQADIAVYRPTSGIWYVKGSRVGIFAMQWGQPGDMVVPADYDGDGKTDIAVFRPSQGVWYQYLSGSQTPTAIFWGSDGDIPVPGDYDGDGKADLAIFRPADGNWWINGSTSGISVQQFGLANDRPVAAAYTH
jgi:FG-GAP-like repeat